MKAVPKILLSSFRHEPCLGQGSYDRLGLAEVASNRRCARDDTMKYCSIDFDGLSACNL